MQDHHSTPDRPPLPQIDQLARQLAEIGREIDQKYLQPARQAAETIARELVRIHNGLVEWLNTPAVQQLIREFQRGDYSPVPDLCACPCPLRHPNNGECEGDAVGTLRVHNRLVGEMDIPMCRPCITAVGQELERRPT